MADIKQALRDFVATSNSGKYQDEQELLSKFPELQGYDLQALKDFVATSNSGKYQSEEELFSKFPEFSVVSQTPKKKGVLASSLEGGSSDLSKSEPTADPLGGFQETLVETPQTQPIEQRKEVIEGSMQEPGKYPMAEKPRGEFEQRLISINKDLIKKTEEKVVPEMNLLFGDFGFKFDEYMVGDFMKVTAPNGNKTVISLDSFTDASAEQNSAKLVEFMKQNKPAGYDLVKTEKKREQEMFIGSEREYKLYQEEYAKKNRLLATKAEVVKSEFDKLKLETEDFVNTFMPNMEAQVAQGKISSVEANKIIKERIAQFENREKELQKQYSEVYERYRGLQGDQEILNKSIERYMNLKGEQVFLPELLIRKAGGQSGKLLANIARTPESIWDVAAAAANKIYEALGIESRASTSAELGQSIGVTNKLAEFFEKRSDKILEIESKYDGSVSNFLANGEYGKASGALVAQITESLPVTMSIIMARGKGGLSAGQTFALTSAVTGAGRLQELNGSEYSEAQKALNATIYGMAEGMEALFGAGPFAAAMKNIVQKEGINKAKQFAAKTMTTILQENKYLNPFTEGMQEVLTAVVQNAADIYVLGEDKKMTDGLMDAFIVGAAMGTGFTTVQAGAEYLAKRGEAKDTKAYMETVKKVASNGNLVDKINAEIDAEVSELRITPEQAVIKKQNVATAVNAYNSIPSEFTDKQKSEAMPLMVEKIELENKIEGKDPALVKAEKTRLEEINLQLENISTKKGGQDAVQIRETEKMDVGKQAGISEGVDAEVSNETEVKEKPKEIETTEEAVLDETTVEESQIDIPSFQAKMAEKVKEIESKTSEKPVTPKERRKKNVKSAVEKLNKQFEKEKLAAEKAAAIPEKMTKSQFMDKAKVVNKGKVQQIKVGDEIIHQQAAGKANGMENAWKKYRKSKMSAEQIRNEKNRFRTNKQKKYRSIEGVTPSLFIQKYLATGGKINRADAEELTGYKANDLFGMVSDNGASLHDLMEQFSDETGIEVTDGAAFDAEVSKILQGGMKQVYGNLNNMLQGEQTEMSYEDTFFEEAQTRLENADDVIDYSDMSLDDALTDAQRAELDSMIAESMNERGEIDFVKVAEQVETELNTETNENTDTTTNESVSRDSAKTTDVEKTESRTEAKRLDPLKDVVSTANALEGVDISSIKETDTKTYELPTPKNVNEARKSAEELLRKAGFEYTYSGQSDTNGISVYFDVDGVKVRFSDHSISNKDRMANEATFYFGNDSDSLKQSILDIKQKRGDNNIEYGQFRTIKRKIDGKELKAFGLRENITPKSLSEAYHKAKADGSNPELVKAVEELLSETPTAKSRARAELEAAKKAFSNKLGGSMQMGGLGALPEFVKLVKAYGKLGIATAQDFLKQFRKDFPQEPITDRSLVRAFTEVNKQLEAQEQLKKDVSQVKKEARTAKERAKRYAERISNLLDSKKTLQETKQAMKDFISEALPDTMYTKGLVDRLLGKINSVTAKNKEAKVQEVLKEVEAARERMRKSTIKQIYDLVSAKAKTTKTPSKKVRGKGLTAEDTGFFALARRIIGLAMKNDLKGMSDISNDLSNVQQLDEMMLKEARGEKLSSIERRTLDKLFAFENYADIMSMSLEQVQDILEDFKGAKSAAIQKFKAKKLKAAEAKAQLHEEAKAQILATAPILYVKNAAGEMVIKDANQLRADRDAIWESFNKLKIWEGIRQWAKLFRFGNTKHFIRSAMGMIKNLQTLTNAIDRTTEGRNFFKDNIYTPLTRMHTKMLEKKYEWDAKYDEIANRIPGVKGGYKAIRRLLRGKDMKIEGLISNRTGTTYSTTFTKDQLLRIYALSKNPVQRQKLYAQGIREKQLAEIEKHLGSEVIQFADGVVEFLSNEGYEAINQIYSEVNNVDLGYMPNYFPTKTVQSQVSTEMIKEGDFVGVFSAETASALKERTDMTSDIDLKGGDFTSVLESHTVTMSRFMGYGVGTKRLNDLFYSKDVDTYLGELGLKGAIKTAINIAINPEAGKDAILKNKLLDSLQSKFTGFALAFKLMQIPKQMSSFIQAYEIYQGGGLMGKVPGLDAIGFLYDYTSLYVNPRKSFMQAYNMSPDFRERVDSFLAGDLSTLESGISSRKRLSKRNDIYGDVMRMAKTAAGSPTAIGDILGVMGYMAVYNRDIANGMSESQAMDRFVQFNETQQSRRGIDKVPLQFNPNALTRGFIMFGSTTILQINRVMQASTNILRNISQGKAPRARDVRSLALNGMVANVFFVFMANIFKYMDGEDEDKEEVMLAMRDAMMMLNLAYQLPYFGAELEKAVAKSRNKRFNPETVLNPLDRIGRTVSKGIKDDLGAYETFIKPIGELALGAQIDPFLGIASAIEEGEVSQEDLYRILGVSASYRPKVQKEGSGITPTDLKKLDPEQWKEFYGPGSDYYEMEQERKALEKELKKEYEEAMKDLQ